MKRLGFCLGLVSLAAAILGAQSPSGPRSTGGTQSTRGPHGPPGTPRTLTVPETFKTYCFECHGGEKHKGNVSLERLIQNWNASSIGDYWDLWDKVAEKIET